MCVYIYIDIYTCIRTYLISVGKTTIRFTLASSWPLGEGAPA